MENVLKPFTHSRNKNRNIFVLVLGAMLVGGGAIAGISQQISPQTQQNNSQQSPIKTSETANTPPPYTLFYGIWADDKSIIKAYDLATKKNYELASLPQNIKRVTSVMPDSLYYINNTDQNDHGQELIKYAISGKQQTVLAKADPGFGIDDYYISPDGRYLTTWEVSLGRGSRQLNGGVSRVYSADVNNPSVKNLLYNEEANKPVHYPRGITNEGNVITDMFLPNSGPGWAYGMGTSDFSGQSKQDITSMVNGTYGRQPRISTDGTRLVFAGYDGARGPGTEQVSGYRRAVIHPNTIEVLSPQSNQRTKLSNLSSNFVFDDVKFDPSGKSLIISQVKYRAPNFITDIRLYNLGDNTTKTVPNSVNKRGFAMVSDSQILAGKPLVSSQSMGNLGETYQFINSNFELININDGKTEIVPIPHANTQYIAVIPNSKISGLGTPELGGSTDTLQMQTFALKPRLMSERINLQSRASGQISSVADKGVQGISILAQVPSNILEPVPSSPGITLNPSNPAVPSVGTPSSPDVPTITNAPSATMAPGGSPAPTVGNGSPAPTVGNGSPAPTVGNGSPMPSIDLSGLPSGIEPPPDISDLSPENIQKLIEWLENLLGILEQETQN